VSALAISRCPSASTLNRSTNGSARDGARIFPRGGRPTTQDGHVLYIEDCLLTGTETLSLLRSLLGQVRPDRTPKTPALEDAETLKKTLIELRFAVVANWGQIVVERFLVEQGLSNISISTSKNGPLVTMTSAGVEAFKTDTLYDNNRAVRDIERSVRKVAFDRSDLWGGSDRTLRAIDFLQDRRPSVVRFLSRSAWVDMASEPRRRGSSWRKRECASVGVCPFDPKGNAAAFLDGWPVAVGSSSLRWLPLFPNAD
jgi:hypothetical protein